MLAVLRQRNFFLLWLGQVISIAGDWVLGLALPFYVYQLTQSTLATGATFIISTLPRILFGSVAGIFVDRWDRKRTMIAADLLRAVLLLALLAVHSVNQLWIVYTVTLVQALISQFFGPAKNALVPNILNKDDLIPGNSLNSLGENISRLIAPPLGGMAMAAFGLYSVVIVDSISFLFSALMLAFIIVPARITEQEEPKPDAASAWVSVWRDWLQGLKLVKENRVLSALFSTIAIAMVGEGIIEVLLIPFISGNLKGDTVVLGWMMSAQAAGGLLGGAAIGWLGKRASPIRLVVLGLLGWGGIDLLIFNIPIIPLMLALFVVVGLPIVGLWVSMNVIIQQEAADQFRGRIFGSFGSTVSLCSLVGMGISSIAGTAVGVLPVLNIAFIVILISCVFAWLRFPASKAEPQLSPIK